jgi:ABC-2 type transport system permease protein
MRTLGLLFRKELLESWRTLRMPVVLALFAAIGLMSPLLARFLPQIIEAAGGDQLGSLVMPTPTAIDAVAQLARNLLQFGALTAILLAMGSVAAEKERGTAAFVVSRSVRRSAFLLAKVAMLGLLLAAGCALSVGLAWAYTEILFEPAMGSIAGWVMFGIEAWLGLCVFAAITFTASVMTGSATVAAGFGLGALLVLSLMAALPSIGDLTPAGLIQGAVAAVPADHPVLDSLAACGVAGTAIAALVGLSIRSFGRQEL